MSNETEIEDGYDDGNDSAGIKNLRAELARVKKEHAELVKSNQELTGRVRTTSLAEILSGKGVPAKIAKFYPSDGEVSEDAVNAWVQENADVFGIDTSTTTEEANEMADNVRLVSRAANSAMPSATAPGENKVVKQRSAEELMHAYATMTRDELVKAGLHHVNGPGHIG